MRGDCTSASAVHYESCLNSTCSRSSSPVRKLLWEPKHPPPEKIKDQNKNDSSLKALGISKSQPQNGEKSMPSFHCHQEAGTQNNGPRCNTDPCISYTINKNDADNRGNSSNNFLVTIQQNFPRTSPPLSRNKTSEPQQPHPYQQDSPAGNLTLQLELDASKNPPTVSISSKNSVISEAAPYFPLSAIPSAPSPPCTPCCHPCAPPPHTSHKLPHLCVGQVAAHPKLSFDATKCLSCSNPCFMTPKITKDKAMSTFLIYDPSRTDENQNSPCQSLSGSCCPCHKNFLPSYRQDRGTSPIKCNSRPPSTIARVSFNATPAHSRSSSVGSQGSIEIDSEGGVYNVDWKGSVKQVDVKLPICHNSRIDIKHNQLDYDPQLEVFYASSCNQSQSRSSPPSLPSPVSDLQYPHPECNPCIKVADICPNGKHLSSSTPWKSRPQSTTPSRTPRSITPVLRDSNDSVHNKHEDPPRSTFSSWNKADDEFQNKCNTPRQLVCHQKKSQLHSSWSPGSQMVNLTPLAAGIRPRNSDVTIQWDEAPTCCKTTCANCTRCYLYEQESIQFEHCTPHPPNHDELVVEEEEYEADELRAQAPAKEAEFQDIPKQFEEPKQPPEAIVQNQYTSPSAPRCMACCALQSDISMPCCPLSCVAPLHGCTCTGANPLCPPPNCTPCCALQTAFNCGYDNCPYCCYGKYNCSINLPPPVYGVNQCTSLPPHLQSDWSASLRCPPNQLHTKPILYRDADNCEHIMFADGSVEHINHHCKPISPAPPPQHSPTPSPPCLSSPLLMCEQECSCYFDEDGGDGDDGHFGPPKELPECTKHGHQCEEAPMYPMEQQEPKYVDFSPRSGDIVIRAAHRFPCLEPGKDNGKVAFYTSNFLDLREHDSLVRLGKLDDSGKWCSSRVVEIYMREKYGRWIILGKHIGHKCLQPLQPDQHQKVRTPSQNFRPRLGDLVISTSPRPNSFYFWNPKQKNLDCYHSQLLLRAFIGQPQVVDSNHNLACCVNEHLPVGYAELYMKVNSVWLFLGRDDHMFSEHELVHYS